MFKYASITYRYGQIHAFVNFLLFLPLLFIFLEYICVTHFINKVKVGFFNNVF